MHRLHLHHHYNVLSRVRLCKEGVYKYNVLNRVRLCKEGVYHHHAVTLAHQITEVKAFSSTSS